MSRILVVDDDGNMRRLINTILTRRGHDVAEAGNGSEALARIDRARPDLVVTDVMMPGGGGLELLDELHDRGIAVKALIVSGNEVQLEGALAAMQAHGTIAVIGKPFTPNELTEAVRALIG